MALHIDRDVTDRQRKAVAAGGKITGDEVVARSAERLARVHSGGRRSGRCDRHQEKKTERQHPAQTSGAQ